MTDSPWPYEADVPKFYGDINSRQVRFCPPYQFYLYDTRTPVHTISVHKKVEDSLTRVLAKVREVYGEKEIDRLHLNRFFGSLVPRPKRGSKSVPSMHSWGIALDFDANRNGLRTRAPKAAFSRPEYSPWWQAWEAEGWVSLGRVRGNDFMHVQAARLNPQ